jgi:hypothetical protein
MCEKRLPCGMTRPGERVQRAKVSRMAHDVVQNVYAWRHGVRRVEVLRELGEVTGVINARRTSRRSRSSTIRTAVSGLPVCEHIVIQSPPRGPADVVTDPQLLDCIALVFAATHSLRLAHLNLVKTSGQAGRKGEPCGCCSGLLGVTLKGALPRSRREVSGAREPLHAAGQPSL